VEQGKLAAISAVMGLIGAAGGLFAAIAAFRSAGTAREASKRAQEVDRRGLVRDVATTANNVIAETIRVDDVGNKLKREYQALATFSGQSGGSRSKLVIEEVERKQEGVVPLQQEAHAILERREIFSNSSEDDLALLLTKLEGHVVQIRRVKEKLLHDLDSVEKDNRRYREKAMTHT
jgi:hypothetical protein